MCLVGYSCAICVPLWVRCCLVLGAGNVMCHVSGTDPNCSGIPNSCHLPERKNAHKLQTVQCSGGYHPLKENRPHEPKHQRGAVSNVTSLSAHNETGQSYGLSTCTSTQSPLSSSQVYAPPSAGYSIGACQRQVASSSSHESYGLGGINPSRSGS